jgi:hypothetical protein
MGRRERVVFHFYLVLDTCKFTLKPKFSLAWKRGRPRDKPWEDVTLRFEL